MKRPPFVIADEKPDSGPYRRMFDGITRAEDTKLQRTANALESQILPGKLLMRVRAALRAKGFVRVQVEWATTSLHFRAQLGRRLKALLRSPQVLDTGEALYGQVTRAARECGLDPRIEDVGIQQHMGGVEGTVRPVPFIVVTGALDKMLDRWAVSRRGRRKRPRVRARACRTKCSVQTGLRSRLAPRRPATSTLHRPPHVSSSYWRALPPRRWSWSRSAAGIGRPTRRPGAGTRPNHNP